MFLGVASILKIYHGLIAQAQRLQNEQKSSGKIPLIPGVLEVLEYIFIERAKIGGIVTSSECEATRSCWRAKKMMGYFGNDDARIVGADDERIRDAHATEGSPNPFLTKPDPRPYQVLLDVLGITAAQAFVVEDTWKGALSAARAGIQCFFVTADAPTEIDLRREFVDGQKDVSAFLVGLFKNHSDFLKFLRFSERTKY
jgi:beta-phosphoglucomutase-like phosphatase (HAD superfamily)